MCVCGVAPRSVPDAISVRFHRCAQRAHCLWPGSAAPPAAPPANPCESLNALIARFGQRGLGIEHFQNDGDARLVPVSAQEADHRAQQPGSGRWTRPTSAWRAALST